MKTFCETYAHINLIKLPACYKNLDRPYAHWSNPYQRSTYISKNVYGWDRDIGFSCNDIDYYEKNI